MTSVIKDNRFGTWIAGILLALMAVSVLPAGAQSIMIVKDAIPFGEPQDFSFSGDLGDFDLDDDSDGTLPDFMSFSVAAGTYEVTEAAVEGWLLTDLSCSDPSENSSTDTDNGTATIVVDGTETVTCTFENSQLGKIIIDKVTLPTGDPTGFDFTLDEVEGPEIDTFTLADQDPPYMTFVLPGFYSVSEDESSEDWELLSFDCDNEDSANDIELFAGDTVTCTAVNEITTESDVGFSKAFAPDSIGPGSSTTLTFTIDNVPGFEPVSLLTFEDVLPGGLTVAAPASAFTDCGGSAILDAPDGGDTIGLSFGGVGAGEICTVTVNVTSSIPGEGPFTNTTSDLTSSDGKSDPATDDLTVDEGKAGFSKSFSPASIPLGGTSTLTFTFDNTANPSTESFFSFQDTLPTDMVVASPANSTTDCFSVGITSGAEGSVIFFSGVLLPAEETCTASVDVTTTSYGVFDNVSSNINLTSLSAPSEDGFATARLEVPFQFLNKVFLDDPVAPGGTVELEFTIQNPSRDFPATGIGFTDDLTFLTDLMATGLPLTEACDADGPGGSPGTGTLSGTTSLTFSGGSLPPEGSCTFSVTLSVPPGAAPDSYTNVTTAITATIDGAGVVGNAASDGLDVSLAPLLTKEYLTNPVGAGGTTTLRFTITNVSSTLPLTDIAFEDVFDDVTPTAGAPVNTCGGTAIFTPFFDGAGFNTPAQLTLSGGGLAASGVCTIDLPLDVVTNATEGTYPNVTGPITALLDGEEPVEGLPAADDLVVVGGPTLTKRFLGDPLDPPGSVILEFTLTHSEVAEEPATGIAFTDDLTFLAGLTATALPPALACDPDGPGGAPGTGTLSGATLLDFSGGVLAPGESCTFSATLSVPMAAAPGPHTNTTSIVTATVDGLSVTGNPASDDLDISGLILTKEFLGGPVIPGETTTLRFTIINDATVAAAGISFSDNLGGSVGTGSMLPGTTVVTPLPDPDPDCGAGSALLSFGGTTLFFTSGSLAAKSFCTFDVTVLVPGGADGGSYTNTTGPVSSSLGTFPLATDVLIVDNVFLLLTKEFSPNPVSPGGTAILEFTITNLHPTTSIVGIAFDDDLDTALIGLEATAAGPDTCGGTIDSMLPTGFFEYSGGTVAGGATCTIELTLSVPSLPIGTLAFNETSVVTGFLGIEGPAVVGDPATDELRLGLLTLEKAFDGPTKAGQTVDLTFTLSNLGTTAAADLGFTDDLESVLPGLIATGLPFAACGGTVTTFDGGSTIVFVAGSLAAAGMPGDSCLFTVTVSVPSEAPVGTFANTTSDLLQLGASIGDPGVDDLVIEPPIDFSKIFLPATIGPGSTTQLVFTISNLDSGLLAEDVAFTDVLPAGVVIATPSSAFTDCTDGVLSAPDGGATISLGGARLGIGATCTVTVNITAAAAGEYDNLSGELTSTAGSGGMAAATLTVDATRPGFSKSFDPAVIPPGGTSTLTFTIANDDETAKSVLTFVDVLPAGLVVATPSNKATTCGGALTAAAGTSTISLALGTLGGASSCTVMVDVTAADAGLYENVSLELSSGTESVSSGFATAELDVFEGFLAKSFLGDPVPPGGTVTLEFTINNPSRDFPATDIEFSDDLDAVLPGTPELTVSGPLPTDPCGAGSTLTVEPVNVLTLAGGSLPAEGSCTFSVTLDVPVGAATGIHDNTTSSITATIDSETEVGDPASDDLRVVAFPSLVKEFLDATTMAPDPVVGAGDDVKIRFTITNTSPTSAATDIAFFDELTTFLPFPVTVSAPTPDPPCGVGSVLAVASCGTECEGLSLTGGSLAAAPGVGSSCTFDVTLSLPTGLATGTYVNTTDEITATVDGEPVAGFPASDTFDLIAAPRLTKEFTDDPVQPGGTVTLEFTLEHDALAPGDAVDVEFTDDLAAVVADLAAAAGELPATDLCGTANGMLVGTAGDTLLTFSGATLTPGDICTFSVTLDVPADAPAGTHTNTTSNVVATVLGVETTENPAQDDLTVGGLILTKSFLDDPVIAGGTVMLEFTLTNLTPAPVSDIVFEDLLDPDVLEGLTVVTPMPLVDPCGTGSLLEIFSAPEITFPPTPAIDEAMRLTGGNLPAATGVEGEGTCTFAVELMVPAATPSGDYVNRTRDLEATIDSTTLPFPDAQDDLTVATGQLLLTKEFTDDPVAPGGTVTLEFTIATLGAFDEASDLAFSDDLEAALSGLAAGPPYDTGSCSGVLTGTSVLDFSGGSLTGGECSFSVTVEVPGGLPIGTTATNTTSSLAGTIDELAVTGEPATDVLFINSFEFSKEFDGPTTPGGTPVLTFTIENLSTTEPVSDLSFTDDFGAIGFPGLEATSLPSEPCGVGSSISGTSLLNMSSGSLLPGGSCTFAVDLLVPPGTAGGNYLNETSNLEILGIAVAAPASASLRIDAPPVFSKAFVPEEGGQGCDNELILTIDNSFSDVSVTDLAFQDMLPFDLLVADDPQVINSCGGDVVATPGSTTIDLSGGSVDAGGSCTISVQVYPPSGGTFENVTGDLTSSVGISEPAVATLVTRPCLAPDGLFLTLTGFQFGDEIYKVCKTIFLGPHFKLLGTAILDLNAGESVIFLDGFEMEANTELTITIDPSLLP